MYSVGVIKALLSQSSELDPFPLISQGHFSDPVGIDYGKHGIRKQTYLNIRTEISPVWVVVIIVKTALTSIPG